MIFLPNVVKNHVLGRGNSSYIPQSSHVTSAIIFPFPPREDGELTLDVGPYTAALEFAADRDAIVCGKPDKTFFQVEIV